ncbi:MAG TPA: 30S ribosomal protein S20 [Vicinamibacteria bacterium]|nr:30S ribosomal protein S20 [Vicinamibacteria bacterium]HZM52302.1 30S ribosomal protein S20 [Vicinamibacteria bacterium]
MAHHASALKQQRQSLKHRDRNRRNVSRLKTKIKSLRSAIAKGDKAAVKGALAETISEIDKAAKKGVIHDNAAARYKSRLSRRVNAVAAAK